jgi:hypothetical protein
MSYSSIFTGSNLFRDDGYPGYRTLAAPNS